MALLYDPNARANKNGFLFSAGDPSVRFGACPGADWAYPGGFIAKHPICLTLDVQTSESSQSGRFLPVWAALVPTETGGLLGDSAHRFPAPLDAGVVLLVAFVAR